MTLDFRTENVDVDVFGLGFSIRYRGRATVEWEIQFETRQHCLKGALVVIKKIECVLTTEGEEIEVNTLLPPYSEWNIESKVKFDDDAECSLSNVKFDFKEKIITVS